MATTDITLCKPVENLKFKFLQCVRIARNADSCNSTTFLSVRLSVRLSVTFRCSVETMKIRSCGLQYQVAQ